MIKCVHLLWSFSIIGRQQLSPTKYTCPATELLDCDMVSSHATHGHNNMCVFSLSTSVAPPSVVLHYPLYPTPTVPPPLTLPHSILPPIPHPTYPHPSPYLLPPTPTLPPTLSHPHPHPIPSPPPPYHNPKPHPTPIHLLTTPPYPIHTNPSSLPSPTLGPCSLLPGPPSSHCDPSRLPDSAPKLSTQSVNAPNWRLHWSCYCCVPTLALTTPSPIHFFAPFP